MSVSMRRVLQLVAVGVAIAQPGTHASRTKISFFDEEQASNRHTSTTKVKKAIFTMACGYSREALTPFFESLKDVGFDGDVNVGVGPDEKVLRYLRTCGLRVILRQDTCNDSGHDFYKKEPPSGGAVILEQTRVVEPGVNQARWMHYKAWLDREQYDEVWMVDARDVVFQADPFINLAEGLSLFVDTHKGQAVKRLEWCLPDGHAVLEQFLTSELPVLCGGTIAGKGPMLGELVTAMADLVQESFKAKPSESVSFQQAECYMYDQHLLAVLAMRKNFHFFEYFDGPAISLGSAETCKHLSKHVDSQGQFLNADGVPFAILHKVDKCDATVQLWTSDQHV